MDSEIFPTVDFFIDPFGKLRYFSNLSKNFLFDQFLREVNLK